MSKKMEGTIIRRIKDEVVPQPFWERVLSTGINTYGMATSMDGQLVWQPGKGEPTVETMMGMDEACTSTEVVFYLGKHPEGASEDDLQPLVLLADQNDAPIVLGIFEGNFSQYLQPGPRADYFWMSEMGIRPALEELWELSGDIDVVSKGLRNTARQDAFCNLPLDRGVSVLVCSNGDIHFYSKNNTVGSAFSWGEVTNTHDYTEKVYPERDLDTSGTGVVEPTEVVLTQAQQAQAKLQAITAGKIKIKPLPAPAATVTKVEPAKPVVAVVPAVSGLKRMVEFNIPGSWSNVVRKEMFNRIGGTLPADWKRLKVYQCEESVAPKGVTLRPIKATLQDLRSSTSQPEPKKEAPAALPAQPGPTVPGVTKPKDTEPAHFMPAHVPLIPAAQRKDFHARFLTPEKVKELKDAAGEPLLTLQRMQDTEKKMPSFSEQMGIDMIDTAGWTFEKRVLLARVYPELIASWSGALMIGFFKHYTPPQKTEQTVGSEDATPKKIKIRAIM